MSYTLSPRDLAIRAKDFATERHAGQVRRYTGEPYITHPAAVAELVRSVPHTEIMLAGAWMHDLVEDGRASLKEIEAKFGADVACMVWMLTRDREASKLPRETRCEIDVLHAKAMSDSAKTIKLADIIDNCSTLNERDPARARVYFAEKRRMLSPLLSGNATLGLRALQLLHSIE